MLGHVIVMREVDYARWLDAGPVTHPEPTPAQRGEGVYQHLACSSCHAATSSVHAPPLEGLYGREVALDGGERVLADDNYLRESILEPKRRIVAGQPASMPSYQGQLSEGDLQNLIAYLRSLPPAKVAS
jgi:cytochrome c oxidase subunit II